MKRILTYILAAAAMMLMSCTDNLEFGKMSKDVLSLEAFSTELQTKTAGEDAYKENIINTVEWFFFKDAEGTQLLHQVHSDGAHLKLQTPETGNYSALRYKSYLYAVANITLPTAPEGGWTLEKLLEIPVSTNFTKTATDDEGNDGQVLDIANLNFIMDTYDEESGEYLFELVPEAVNDDRKITVPLSRLAVKISTMIKIKKEVTTVDSFGNEETWTPVLSETDFDVYMVDALKAGYLSGEPVRRAEATDEHITGSYFTYARNLVEVKEVKNAAGGETGDSGEGGETGDSGEGGETGGTGETGEGEGDDDYYIWQTVNPFYTYPQKWNGEDNGEPFIKIIFPWMSDVKGSSEFHYKIVLPQPKDGVFTLSRNCWYQVEATIEVLGGTENDYVLVDNVHYSVADWAEPSWFAGSGLSSPIYFLVPQTVFHIYSVDEFDIPFYCDNQTNVVAYFTSISFKDYSGKETVDKGGEIVVAEGVDPKTITTVTSGGQGQSAWEDTERPYTLTVDNTNKVVKFIHKMNDIYTLREIHLVIYKNASKYSEVTIYQHPAIELKKQGAGDVFVNGYFGRVENATFGSSNLTGSYYTRSGNRYYEATYTASNAPYYHCWSGFDSGLTDDETYQPNGYFLYLDYRYHSFVESGMGLAFSLNTDYGSIMVTTNNLNETISQNFYTTDITVTAFSTTNNKYTLGETTRSDWNGQLTNYTYEYRIADPRVKASVHYPNWELNDYLSNETGNSASNPGPVTSDWTSPLDILISSQATPDRPKIAPRFLVSSALNANTGLTWEQVIKRAATYQEAGYPAGRWRVPTEAEMAFIVARQKDGTLPNLYAEDTDYWAGSGRILRTNTSGEISARNRANNDSQSVRFVYDLWYWGDEPMSTNVYHANSHIESN